MSHRCRSRTLRCSSTNKPPIAALSLQAPTRPIEPLKRSVSWDRGKELSAHLALTEKTGVPVFFADPHSPWQRGTNENTNGLLRQHFPRNRSVGVAPCRHP
ncbi:putative transposase [Gordonia rubripertincta NBRC 101908]|uniref:Transposase n=1 Tax=Gordonia rubripertincta NBRC 101908 TaxID=1077975 RepID=A0ABQ0HVF7_GORRU|nr:putative transposase [Gordonia rubripertincta NBRC 101908]